MLSTIAFKPQLLYSDVSSRIMRQVVLFGCLATLLLWCGCKAPLLAMLVPLSVLSLALLGVSSTSLLSALVPCLLGALVYAALQHQLLLQVFGEIHGVLHAFTITLLVVDAVLMYFRWKYNQLCRQAHDLCSHAPHTPTPERGPTCKSEGRIRNHLSETMKTLRPGRPGPH